MAAKPSEREELMGCSSQFPRSKRQSDWHAPHHLPKHRLLRNVTPTALNYGE
jgi:hypothetical protein